MKPQRIFALVAVALLVTSASADAEDNMVQLEHRLAENGEAIEAIALYPEEIRDAIFETAANPELVVKLGKIQERGTTAFARLLIPYNDRQQQDLWRLSRFPQLIDQLAAPEVKSARQVKSIVAEYPKEIRPIARKYRHSHRDLLVRLARLNRRTAAGFDKIIAPYPHQVQQSAATLQRHPEILALLNEDLDLTILLGDAYKSHPHKVRKRAAALHLEAARQQAQTAKGQGENYSQTDDATDAPYTPRYDYDIHSLDGPDADEDQVEVVYHNTHHGYYGYPYPYQHGYLSWYPTPHLSATFGIGAPILHRPVPIYRPYGYQRGYYPRYYNQPLRSKRYRRHWRRY